MGRPVVAMTNRKHRHLSSLVCIAAKLLYDVDVQFIDLQCFHSFFSNLSTHPSSGAQKAGTSAFYHLLGAHPAIRSSFRFEPHFFDKQVKEIKHYRDISTLEKSEICSYRQEYRQLWSPSARRKGAITFEKTPVYLCKYHIAPYMKAIAPWTKILVILRNPIDRAFSNWKLSFQTFENMKPFDHVVLNEMQHLKKFGLSDVPLLNETIAAADDDGTASFALPVPYEKRGDRALEISPTLNLKKKDKLKCGMVSRGFYAEQLSMWMRYFPLGEKLKVIRYEAFLENRAEILREVLDFVGAPAMSFEDLDLDKSYSPERDGAPYEGKMPDHVRKYLRRLYKPYNDELADLLGEEWRDVWD